MTAFRKTLIVIGFISFTIAAFGSAQNIYITQSGAPSGSCTSNVQTPAFFNNAANWGNGAAQIGPGTTVLICGAFTGAAGASEFTFQGSGSNGNPITLLFDAGTQLNSPYWSSNGAISCNNLSYVTVDGGSNGVIQNTSNGTNLANHQGSAGFYGGNCIHATIQNLVIQNLYMNAGNNSAASDVGGAGTEDIFLQGNSTGDVVTNNVLSGSRSGIAVAFDHADSSNVTISNNKISDHSWQIQFASGSPGSTSTGSAIFGNDISNWTNWQWPTNTYHQDGIIAFNCYGCSSLPSAPLPLSIYNNYIHGDLGTGSATGFIFCHSWITCTIFNNVLDSTANTPPGIIWLGANGGPHQVYNNTIIGPPGATGGIAVSISTASYGKYSFKNNLIQDIGIGLHDYNTITADVGSSDHNIWYLSAGGTVQMAQNDSTFITYSAWKASGFETGSSTSNPFLNSAFVPQTGPAIGTGANLSAVGVTALSTDKVGSLRPPMPAMWDIGALQSGSNVPSPTAPAGLTALVQ